MNLSDLIIGAESGGDPNATNPNSSASGPSQFIDSTWLSMLAKHRPDIQGSPQDLLALKTDPQLSREMTDAYARDNGQILSNAGLPVTPGTQYLAHFAGPGGAVKALQADPNAPVSSVLGDAAVKANPFLQNMTVSDLRSWADRKMGISVPLTPGSAAPPLPPGTNVASLQIGQAAPQTPQFRPPAAPSSPLPQIAPQAASGLMGTMPASQSGAPPPIFYAPRKPIDLSHLAAALQASGNRGFFFNKG